MSFCDFNLSTKISEVVKLCVLDKTDENYTKKYKVTPKGLFDTVVYISIKIYEMDHPNTSLSSSYTTLAYKNSTPSTLTNTIGKNVDGFTTNTRELNKYIKGSNLNSDSTLQELVDLMKEYNHWLDGKKENFITYLTASSNTTTQTGGKTMSDKEIKVITEDAIVKNNQVIFTGALGTGKTYSVREYVKKKVTEKDGKGNDVINENRYKFVQFHSSYDYTDFVEGLRPAVTTVNGKFENAFVRMDGVFKEFCRKIVMANWFSDEKDKTYEKLNEIYTQHSNSKHSNENKTSDQEKDVKTSDKMYYFIIDEINRADLSRVFGELMFGLEESYRGIENRFDTQYKNLPTYEMVNGKAKPMAFDCFRDGFFVPENLKIIGTMNDIDRSVETFDFALRRRFTWIDIKANDIMETSLSSMLNPNNDKDKKAITTLASCAKAMNKVISGTAGEKFGLNEAYHIGPAYFKKFDLNSYYEDEDTYLGNLFEAQISPILHEYVRGRKDANGFVDNCKEKFVEVNTNAQTPQSNTSNGGVNS